MSSIRIHNLSKVYADGTHAVKGIDLTIRDGEFIVLVGPSGCGKSTLLRMIAGLETITTGDLYIGEQRVNQLEPAQRDIAMVFQNYALYPHMTVYQNMAYGLKNRGWQKSAIEERVRKTAQMLEIEHHLTRKPKALSGGQRQRVAMGRALVREPAAFLLDEPLSNLDAKLRVQMRVEIKQLQRRLQTTSLYVTHDQLEAMTLGDRLVVLNQGQIEQVGAPLEVYQRPETLFVASFIGSPNMNLIPVQAINHPLNQAALATLPQQTDILGVRPDKLLLQPPTTPHIQFECSMTLFEPAGAESHLYMRLCSDEHNLVMRVESMSELFQQPSFTVYAEIQHLHPFNQSSGKRTDS
ncbi:MAG: sn-glycerol-3-phosphate ABC transporter ATP-binding protein UgpC [Nitrincola lacisaponensis]|uniref:Glycerol-3-phosphate ABC transporter, ATP-binding protein UgpC n=1 Tax=Nitrincola lacisaponensis TaxID=267850 RepID=A0A063Y7U5_9GAMM|nr:sn-glycerol-3-phosphate ABC transporter ATP-binding protein UgpC [Nitrincola lacisaponensis]KDE41200.1 Glycerol-3-phosphate ABC transporter, ATP-binding protein UgpC [Nitrincola lacisaponensis]